MGGQEECLYVLLLSLGVLGCLDHREEQKIHYMMSLDGHVASASATFAETLGLRALNHHA